MSEVHQSNSSTEQKPTDKELNFRALQAKYEKELASANADRERLAKELEERQKNKQDDEDEYSEPYIDHKKLNKELTRFGKQSKQETQTEIQRAVHSALENERRQNWLKQNGDFYQVLEHAEKFANYDPELAETILSMPEGFERQKLVYKNIKALGLHKPEVKEQSIQEKVDSNRRSPFYQPSGISNSPYIPAGGDFSKSGQKQAYDKMQEMKNKLRLG